MLNGQEGYIKAIDIGLDLGYGQCLVEYNSDTIIGLSRCWEDADGWSNHHKMCFSVFDKTGDLLRTDTYPDSLFMHNDLHNHLYLSDNKVVAYCSGYDLIGYWLEYDVDGGVVTVINDGLFPDDIVIKSSGFIQLDNGQYSAIYNDFNPPHDSGIGRFDQNFNLIDFINIQPPSDANLVIYLIEKEANNNQLIAGVYQHDEPGLLLRKPFFKEYTLDGELVWEYDLPETYNNYHVDAILPLEDEDAIICTFEYTEFINGEGSEHRVAKISKTDGVVWDIPFGFRKEQAISNHVLPNIFKSYDDDGYIVAGSVYVTDSIWYNRAMIGKISPEGDSLWMRTYAVSETYNARNSINDFVKSSDGGFIGIGDQAYGTTSATPEGEDIRKVLLIKTDKDGYITPPIGSSTEIIASDIGVTLYPNPASDYLTIYQESEKALDLTLFDAQGQELYQSTTTGGSHYLFHNVSIYPEGHYYLHVSDGKALEVLPIVVCH